ncbi:hypothetical protein [Streptomyces erythrochromogenes]|uniref:hypothetical protein n=1 Tax=Streptomyces erythrochromogenes TaxID=285574 RepID=UPI00030044E0
MSSTECRQPSCWSWHPGSGRHPRHGLGGVRVQREWLRAIEYMTQDRRGFWEERGYHDIADPWTGQRHSYQEHDGA